MGRIAAGWGLAKLSLRVVASDGSLSVLVVLGGIASGAVALAFLAPAAVAYSIDERWLAAIIGGLGVYLSTVAATYFAVALAAAAAEVLDDRDATVRGGMAVASRCVGAILGWALVLRSIPKFPSSRSHPAWSARCHAISDSTAEHLVDESLLTVDQLPR